MIAFNESQKPLSGDLEKAPYEEHMLRSDEKFIVWESKKFCERQSIFKKVSSLGKYPQDLLSIWICEQMDILLAKSVVD